MYKTVYKKTKILATLGPASNSVEMIEGLVKAGTNMFRLNFSHGDHEYHLETLKNIRKVMNKLDVTIAVLQDISGPKVRIGEIKDKFELFQGDEITFVKDEIIGYKVADKKYIVSTNYPELLDKVKIDEYIYLYDGTIRAKVIETGEKVVALVENHGTLTSKKGINFPNTVIDINVITRKDEEDIAWGVKNKVDYFAISFVQNKKDMEKARELLGDYEGKLIAKIEKFDAVQNIDEIVECHTTSGDKDYLLKVMVESIEEYEFILKTKLAHLPLVDHFSSTFALKQVKNTTELPIKNI